MLLTNVVPLYCSSSSSPPTAEDRHSRLQENDGDRERVDAAFPQRKSWQAAATVRRTHIDTREAFTEGTDRSQMMERRNRREYLLDMYSDTAEAFHHAC